MNLSPEIRRKIKEEQIKNAPEVKLTSNPIGLIKDKISNESVLMNSEYSDLPLKVKYSPIQNLN